MSNNKSGCLTGVLFLLLCGSMLGNLVLFGLLASAGSGSAPSSFRPSSSTVFQEEVILSGGPRKVVVIPLEGVIAYSMTGESGESMVGEFKQALEQAANDANVAAVVLSVDSPGGEITASDVLFHAIKNFSPEKPVVVFMNSIGASGAYYAACGADWIMCNPTTFTGSIGVIISTLNYQDLFGKIGLQSVIFKSGKFKDMLNGAREITPEEMEYVQGLVMQSYERFLGIVAESRNLPAEKLRNGPADGRILSGTDALREGLVDQTGFVEEAYGKAMELAGAEGLSVVRYRPVFNFSSFFRLFGESALAKPEVNLLPSKPVLEPGRVYLLPPMFVP